MNLFSNFLLSILPLFGQVGGWTQFTPSTDTRIVYVSSSTGNDSNNGLSESTPKRTIDKGEDLIRAGFPDWLLLKAGDVWNESLGQWKKPGRSPTERILISYYGVGDRPKLQTGNTQGVWTNGSGGTPFNLDNWVINGLHFVANTYNGHGDIKGIQLLRSTSHFLLEDCVFQNYTGNVILMGFDGPLNDIVVRRCIIIDAYSIDAGHSQGFYMEKAHGVLIEENVIDHNGWQQGADSTATIFNHNMYIQNNCSNVAVIGNIITNGSSHGLQLRCGGTVNNNLFARNSISLLVGAGNSSTPGGVVAEIWNNVIIDGKNINANLPRGWGIVLNNIKNGNVVGNIITTNTNGTQPTSMSLEGNSNFGIKNVNFTDNIVYNWGPGPSLQGNSSQLNGLVWRKNSFQDHTSNRPLLEYTDAMNSSAVISRRNLFYRQGSTNNWFKINNVDMSLAQWKNVVADQNSASLQIHYIDPNRSVGRYNYSLGGAPSHDAFMQSARSRPLHTWPTALTAMSINYYIKDGFKQ